ncbi:MAG: undecaprenyldiphospho-muramoylpentapeptide beta-N-acetylglucosaminyltransferase [Acidobacteria bacterium]|nr:undecaprenyldiphospho-muramoylpentapeptide beta-N-acetylglucosaminyltransferase [Acidobacteriota bacterium]
MIAAGKTGGHIFPGIALAREIRARRPDAPILFIGTPEGLEHRLVPEAGFPLESVRASGFVGKNLGARLRSLVNLPLGFFQARRILRRHRARAVAGMGGYVSVPVLAAARSLGIPTVIHDSDALPGVSSRMLNRIATRTAVGVAESNRRMTRPGAVTGTPVRPEFFEAPASRPAGGPGRVLVFGGSQGAAVLNRAMAEASRALRADGLSVIHQTGEKHLASTRALYGSVPAGWSLQAFLPRLWEPLAWADLVVSRAGAMTLAELAAGGRPAILVPFGAAAHGHQAANALAFSRAGAARVIEETGLNGPRLAEEIRSLFADRPRLAAMAAAARSLAAPDAARRLADLLFEAEAAGSAA